MDEAEQNRAGAHKLGRRGWLAFGGGFLLAATLAVFTPLILIFTNGERLSAGAATGLTRHLLWDHPTEIDSKVNRAAGTQEASFSADGEIMLCSRFYHADQTDLFQVRRLPEGWDRAEPLARLNSPYNERSPRFAEDGRVILFASDRPGGSGGFDLYFSVKTVQGWSAPRPVPGVNTRADELDPAQGGSWIYYASNRGMETESFDLYRLEAQFEPAAEPVNVLDSVIEGDPEAVAQVNSDANERHPALNAAGTVLYFASDRKGGFGGSDIYRAYRTANGDFSAPAGLGKILNTAFDEIAPTLSRDGFRLYLGSNQASGNLSDFQFGLARSREAYLTVDWALLRKILIAALATALTIAVIYYLLRLFFRSQKCMEMIPRYLLASLVFHVLLALLSGTWILSTQIADKDSGREAPMTVNLHNLARESIALSIKESAASLPTPQSAEAPATERMEMPDTIAEADAQPVESKVAKASERIPLTEVAVKSASAAAVSKATQRPSRSRPGRVSKAVAQIDPVALGPSNSPIKMPEGLRQRGDDQGELLNRDAAERLPEAERTVAERSAHALEFDLGADPGSRPGEGIAAKARTSVRGHGAWTEHVPRVQMASLGRPSQAPRRMGNSHIPAALAAPGHHASVDAVGGLTFKNALKMEVGGRSAAVVQASILPEAPTATSRTDFSLSAGQPVSFQQAIAALPQLLDLPDDFDAFGFRAFLARLAGLDGVGGRVAAETPGLLLPASAELEVPEWMAE
jgi:hypothetical protein